MIHLAPADIAVILLFFAAVLFIGYRSVRRTKATQVDFLLAGRSLTLPVFIMTLVSSWYGGILGVGEFSYRYGLSNWFVQGVPYYVFALVFALALAKRVRATNLYSIPDKLAAAYDRKTALLGTLLTFILMTPAPYILMLGLFLQMLFGWSLLFSLVVTAIVAVSYLYAGGFRSDVHTDVLEFIVMFIGFAVIIPYSVKQYGGLDFLTSHLPPLHLTWHGGNTVQYIIVWFFIALWTLIDPAFYQRCLAAKSGAVARNGILLSIPFWFLFDAMTATAGLYARAALPGLAQPMMSYPLLAEQVLPPVAKGMFFVGMLATIMSSLNTLAFVSAQTLGRDFWLRWKRPELLSVDNAATRSTQIGLVVSFFFSVVLALTIPSVIDIWYTIGTIIIPGLLVPLMASYFSPLRIPAPVAFSAMLFGWITSTAWLFARYLPPGGGYPFGIEPMYPGLIVSIMIWGYGKIKQRATPST
jgi:SSS family solute:Na+ symporter